jgi:putative redox protein
MATTPSTITSIWTGGRQFVHRSATGHALVTDTPVEAGGGNTAPTPMELVIMGLAGCTGVDITSILEGMRQPLRALQVTAEYERADDHPRVFTRIALHYRLQGDLDPARVARAVALSMDKYCSVSAMLAGRATITHDVEILP